MGTVLPQRVRSLVPERIRDAPRLRALAVGAGVIPPRTMHSQAEADRVWRAAMEHNRTPMSDVEDDETFWNGTPEQLAEKLAPYVELGFTTVISEQPAPYDVQLGLLGVQQYRQQHVAADALPIAPPKGVTSAKDTLVVATLQEPGSLFYLEEGTATAERHVWPITFADNLVGMDDRSTTFPSPPGMCPH